VYNYTPFSLIFYFCRLDSIDMHNNLIKVERGLVKSDNSNAYATL